jgi:uncharacterized protein (DUF1501 family)
MDSRDTPRIPCPGPLSRREFLRLGLVGLGSLTWPELLRRRAEAGTNRPRSDRALLVVWLHGGASHLETYDPKAGAQEKAARRIRQATPTRPPSLVVTTIRRVVHCG